MPHASWVACAALAGAIGLAMPAAAQEVQGKSLGSFTTHAGFKDIGTVHKITNDHMMAEGTAWGVVFNDEGQGILHMGTAMCPHFSEIIGSSVTEVGECTWNDVSGDKIFTRFSATGDMKSHTVTGDQTIRGGTGIFAGIEGKAPFKCQAVSAEGQFACETDWTYQFAASGFPKK